MLVQKVVAVGASSAMVCLFFGVAAPPPRVRVRPR